MKKTIKQRIVTLCVSALVLLAVVVSAVAIVSERRLILNKFNTVGEIQLRNGENFFNSQAMQASENLNLMVNNDNFFVNRYSQGVKKDYIPEELYTVMDNMTTEQFCISPMMLNYDGEYVNAFAYKKVKETKEVVNIGEVNDRYFQVFIDSVTNAIDKNDIGFIVKADGTVIVSSDMELMMNAGNINDLNGGFSSFISELTQETSVSKQMKFNGLNYFTIGKQITQNEQYSEPLYVIYATDYSNITNTFIRSCVLIIALALVTIVISCIFSAKYASMISDPIVDATKQIERIADGDLTDNMGSYTTNDETQIITEALRSTIGSLNDYVSEINRVASSIADYDLSTGMNDEVAFKGTFEAIKSALSDIIKSLRSVIGSIGQTCVQVDSSAKQVANGAQMLADSSSREAVAIEEMARMNNSMVALIHKNNNSAVETRNYSSEVLAQIENSVNALNELSASMTAIESSSLEISKIIKVISDIAFQTNILALNASVEAAKAGAAGRGFSVVADEVKNLANSSAKAAKQTEALITRSTDSVREGGKKMEAVFRSFTEISKSVNNMNGMIDAIADNCGEQQKSIKFIEDKLLGITNAVQSNSATAEESAAASAELSSQASQLKNTFERFRL